MSKRLDETLDPRAEALLLERAVRALDASEQDELARLGAADDESFDLAAAAVVLATHVPDEQLPGTLAARILAAATADRRAPGWPETPPRPQVPAAVDRRARRRPVVAWTVAAACLALAVVAWWSARAPHVEVARVPTPTEARAALLASVSDTATIPWVPTKDPAGQGAGGDVVWSPRAQRGYMRFVGLAPNDPAASQYQLWIFDRARDALYPVDGGVFDVGSTGEVVVSIAPKLRVSDATLFAITVERPGGVVVSKRERIVVTATPASDHPG